MFLWFIQSTLGITLLLVRGIIPNGEFLQFLRNVLFHHPNQSSLSTTKPAKDLRLGSMYRRLSLPLATPCSTLPEPKARVGRKEHPSGFSQQFGTRYHPVPQIPMVYPMKICQNSLLMFVVFPHSMFARLPYFGETDQQTGWLVTADSGRGELDEWISLGNHAEWRNCEW